jgi:mevalonate kinase
MKQVTATAPGKIILFGEHAVVYGQPAIAVPVTEVQASATLESTPANDGLRIVAPDLNRDYWLAEAAVDDPLAAIIKLTLQKLDRPVPPQAKLTVASTIPLGRGMGSGAAISTAVARALSQFYQQPLTPAEVSSLVFEVEKLYHGTPSGIDNTVVAFARPVYFIKGQPLQRMRVTRPFTIVVGDTGVVASTRQVVGDVRRRRQVEPERYDKYFAQIGAIAPQARAIIEQGTADLSTLGQLMNDNQALLETIGVSSPELERLIEAARKAGALGAKLSGAGWGGNMIGLVSAEPQAVKQISEALLEQGAVNVIVTQIRSE